MNFIKEKKLVIMSLSAVFFILVATYTTFETKCFTLGCSASLRENLIVPLFWLMLCLVPIVGIFFFFSQNLFRLWIKIVAGWYLIISLVIIFSIDSSSSFILSTDKSVAVVNLMAGLFILTVIFIFIQIKTSQK